MTFRLRGNAIRGQGSVLCLGREFGLGIQVGFVLGVSCSWQLAVKRS